MAELGSFIGNSKDVWFGWLVSEEMNDMRGQRQIRDICFLSASVWFVLFCFESNKVFLLEVWIIGLQLACVPVSRSWPVMAPLISRLVDQSACT